MSEGLSTGNPADLTEKSQRRGSGQILNSNQLNVYSPIKQTKNT